MWTRNSVKMTEKDGVDAERFCLKTLFSNLCSVDVASGGAACIYT